MPPTLPPAARVNTAAQGNPAGQVMLEPLTMRAALVPDSIDAEARTVEVTFTTGERVLRRPMFDEPFWEELGTRPEEVILDRLNRGASVLDGHGQPTHQGGMPGLRDVLGVVERAWIAGPDDLRALLRFSRRNEPSEEAWQGVLEGVVRHVSPGYRVHRYVEVERAEGEYPVRRAVLWEPFELSVLPIAADGNAQVRAPETLHACTIIRGAETMPPQDPQPTTEPAAPRPSNAPAAGGESRARTETPTDATRTEPASTAAPSSPPTDETRAAPRSASSPQPPQGAADASAAVERERQRGLEIRAAVSAAGLEEAVADDLIRRGLPLEDAQRRVFQLMREAQDAGPQVRGSSVQVGSEAGDHVLRGVEEAMRFRAGTIAHADMSDAGRRYMGLDLIRTAEQLLRLRGIDTGMMSNLELATRALHSTSDFPLLVANVANHSLRQAYEETPRTFLPISRRRDLRDFKPTTELQLGNAPDLEPLGEGGEIKLGTMGEAGETWGLSTHAKRIALTRELLINDDTDAFSRLPSAFGGSAAEVESSVFWALVTGEVVLDETGLALFNAAHNNTGGGALGKAGVQTGRQIMRQQKGIPYTGANARLITVLPAYLIVPGSLELEARQIVTSITPNQSAEVNPWSNAFRDVIVEPRLDAESTAEWYMTAAPGRLDVGLYGYLQGMNGPMIETQEMFTSWGMELRAVHTFGAAIPDFRGWYRSTGV